MSFHCSFMDKPSDPAHIQCVMECACIGAVIISVFLAIVMFRLSGQNFKWRVIAGPIMLALAIVSIAFASVGDRTSCWHWACISFWAIGPPSYFLIEYTFEGNIEGPTFEHLKYSQDLATKLWAGVVALLTLLYQQFGSPQ